MEDIQKLGIKKDIKRKNDFLNSLNKNQDINDIQDVKGKLSFSFRYFDSNQEAGQDFKDWNNEQKNQLLNKLKEYSKESKVYWLNQRVGKGGLKILEIYGAFPRNSDFKKPIYIPDEIKWARFRLESAVRLVGFFIEEETAKKYGISADIFYIVFLDAFHRFYKIGEEK